jgi:hypothetical protein
VLPVRCRLVEPSAARLLIAQVSGRIDESNNGIKYLLTWDKVPPMFLPKAVSQSGE